MSHAVRVFGCVVLVLGSLFLVDCRGDAALNPRLVLFYVVDGFDDRCEEDWNLEILLRLDVFVCMVL